jgi:hypothetical protein
VIGGVCAFGLAANARADAVPAETTPAPTVTAPDAAPPAPDPGPVRAVHKPAPVVKPTPRPAAPVTPAVARAPVVQTPVRTPVTVQTKVTPHRMRAHKAVTPVKHKKKPVQRPSVPAPAKAAPARTHRPRATPVAPVIALAAPTKANGGNWLVVAIGGAVGALLLGVAAFATVRALRRSPLAAPAIAGGAALAAVEPVAPPRPDPMPMLLPDPPEEVETQVTECVVAWWRGYVKSQFIAYDADGDIVAESPPFAWRSRTPPGRGRDAIAAHDALLAQLDRLGWEIVEEGPEWYERLLHPAASDETAPLELPRPELAHTETPRR